MSLYRVLQNLIEKKFSFNDIELANVRYEPTINGRPDLVVEAIDKGKKIALLVTETCARVYVKEEVLERMMVLFFNKDSYFSC